MVFLLARCYKKKLQNKSGQAIVEYVLVMAVFVTLTAWGLNMLKCSLHQVWVQMACDILYPYPVKDSSMSNMPENKTYCEPLKTNCLPSI